MASNAITRKRQRNAKTGAVVWQAMRFFNQLGVVDSKELALEDRTCSICQLPYNDSEDGKSKDIPVQLPCLHSFGKVCLPRWWITPLAAWKNNQNSEREELHGWFENQIIKFPWLTISSCLQCRSTLLQEPQMFLDSALGEIHVDKAAYLDTQGIFRNQP